ncbi:TatD family hydrolase [Algimonas porphyrae]|uniref:LuxR family transcriptional regulator n=1 Tax=Algimonas porphyrae TaxID=1128113 RepID=A0ABQ5UUX7_9PROT|nr:TatD family hydrolase [Algimonas porphyrae]GLQ19080.1 LuxR family transcriptional regulator [Algimonas porphyrae]
MIIDSHVNLHGERFAEDLDDVILRAREAGVSHMLNICCNIKDFEAVIAIAEAHDHIWATVGTHPHDAKDNPDLTADTLIDMAAHPKVVGIGETGFDFHYGYSTRDDQIANFAAHIEAARETQLPLVIHTREADELMLDTLQKSGAGQDYPALLHCYTSGEALAEWAADAGLYFSVSGIVTFKNAHDVRARIQVMPDDHIMLETDCPYLAPVPHRGRRNEPAFLTHVADGLADVKGWTRAETEDRTNAAFFRLFKKITA